jgi:hypothetical protein
VNLDRHFPGRLLYLMPASFVLFLSRELLRWQFPAIAASEAVGRLAMFSRESFTS